MRNRTLIFVVLLCALTQTGCKFKGEGHTPAGSNGEGVAATQPAYWVVRPVTIRVYPASTLRKVADVWVLELRIEALDEMGDPTKAVGRLLFDLNSGGRQSEAGVGQQIDHWSEPLMTREDNRRLYDPITRTYHVTRALTGVVVPGQAVVVRIVLEPAVGARIDATATLTVEP